MVHRLFFSAHLDRSRYLLQLCHLLPEEKTPTKKVSKSDLFSLNQDFEKRAVTSRILTLHPVLFLFDNRRRSLPRKKVMTSKCAKVVSKPKRAGKCFKDHECATHLRGFSAYFSRGPLVFPGKKKQKLKKQIL